MEKVLRSMRGVLPHDTARVQMLMKKYPPREEMTTQRLQKAILKKDPKEMKVALEDVETRIIRGTGKFNFILRNIPQVGQSVLTGEDVPVGYQEMRETLEQWGKLESIEIMKSHVYAKFQDISCAKECHRKINSMMMGENIIKSEIV